MFETYDVKSEQLGFFEANRRGPNLSILLGNVEHATIEFVDKTRYRFHSPQSSLVGRAGVSHSEREANTWYLSAFDTTTKIKRLEGTVRGDSFANYSESVIAIDEFDVCTCKFDQSEMSLSRNDGEIVGTRKRLDAGSGIYARIEILDRLEPVTKDYLLILLCLLGKKNPWFVMQVPFGACQGYPGVL